MPFASWSSVGSTSSRSTGCPTRRRSYKGCCNRARRGEGTRRRRESSGTPPLAAPPSSCPLLPVRRGQGHWLGRPCRGISFIQYFLSYSLSLPFLNLKTLSGVLPHPLHQDMCRHLLCPHKACKHFFPSLSYSQ